MSKLIKIYGERNTNTNYLHVLIRLNLDARLVPGVAPRSVIRLERALPGSQRVRDLYFSLFYQHTLGWKHTRVKTPAELRKYGVLKGGVCFVTITKNPYAWLLSLHRRPYERLDRNEQTFESFLQSPWRCIGRENCEQVLKSPVELWNIKNSSYLQLDSLNALHLTAESMIASPQAIIDRISSHFEIRKFSDEFVNYEQSTKIESSKKDFAYYQDYYMNERWRDKLSDEAVAIINETVDKDLLRHFGYTALS